MSDDDADVEEDIDAGEGDASQEAAAEQASDESEGQPPVEDDELAALDAVREEVAEETSPPDSDEEDDGDDTSGDEAAESAPSAATSDVPGESDTAGDFYVNTLVSVSNMVIDEHGRDGADKIDDGLLRQMNVDDAVDELLADDGGPDLPPEQQVLLGTSVFAVAMLATKTTVLDQALGNTDFTP